MSKPSPRPEDLVPKRREIPLSLRLSSADMEALRTLADRADVGHTTLARGIIESYLAQHAPKRGRG